MVADLWYNVFVKADYDKLEVDIAGDAPASRGECREGGLDCPDCASGHEANASRIYAFSEMEADHVSAWSRGGDTTETNCQMLCKHHNRVKGNC